MSSFHLRSFCWGAVVTLCLCLLVLGLGRQNLTEREIHSNVIPQKFVVETRVADDDAKRPGSFNSKDQSEEKSNDQYEENVRGDDILPVKSYVSSGPMDPFELDYADNPVRHVGVFIDPEELVEPN